MKNFSWLSGCPKSSFPSSEFRSFEYSGSWQKQFINSYLEEGFLNGFEKATARLCDHKNEHFKFFPPNTYSLISLENRKLWLSSPIAFNDHFHSYIGIEEDIYIKTYVLKELKKRHLIDINGAQDRISEEEYWLLFHSHSKDEELRFLSTKRKFST